MSKLSPRHTPLVSLNWPVRLIVFEATVLQIESVMLLTTDGSSPLLTRAEDVYNRLLGVRSCTVMLCCTDRLATFPAVNTCVWTVVPLTLSRIVKVVPALDE